MTRPYALALSCLLGALALAPAARADIALPPVVLDVEGERALLTGAAPDRASFLIRNRSDEAIEVYLFRVVLRDDATRVPLRIARVEVEGRAQRRTVRVPARGQLRVTVRFAIPRRLQGRADYVLELRVRHDGAGDAHSTPALLSRSPDGPEKWILMTGLPPSLFGSE